MKKPYCKCSSALLWLALAHTGPLAAHSDEAELETVDVVGRRASLVGEAVSASQGSVGRKELLARPLLRAGEILETVPGMVVTQHSGSGKANQYFLRGFNLDHGTDFRTTYDRMPLNMPTHGHGQGYTDMNFVIPELLQSIEYAKGPYYADVGDFSGAGSAAMTPLNTLDQGLLQLGVGKDGFGRLLAADSISVGAGNLLAGLEAQTYDGPWSDINEDIRKINGIARYSQSYGENQFQLTFMAYDNSWNAADQIPQRAVNEGLIDRLGSIDTSDAGESSRYSLSGSWQGRHWRSSAYAIRYDLKLWSNFTYWLEDPVNGDQFEQVDKRWIYGGELAHEDTFVFAGFDFENAFGLQLRYDDIEQVGLYQTRERERLGTINAAGVDEATTGLYWSGTLHWAERWRANLGLRYDHYWFDVDSQQALNSGKADDGITSYKFNLSYQPAQNWEAYLGAGTGFHSNDARGVTIQVDPLSGEAVNSVDPLVRSKGAEIGARYFLSDTVNISMALWALALDSELVFVGDAGNTEASRSSHRQGVELTAYWWFADNWTLDMEYAYSAAKFTEDDPADPDVGDEIPGAIPQVFSAGISYDKQFGPFASARVRYFGPRPLVESGQIESDSSTVVNLRAGYRWQQWQLFGDILNLFDSKDHDIDYYYSSRLPGEPSQGVEDIHFHPLEPRTYRLYLTYTF